MYVRVMDMKEKLKKAALAAKITGMLLAAAYCIAESGRVSGAVSGALERCIYVVVPSLFAMTAVSSALVRSGICRTVGRLADFPARKVFGMNGEEFSVFLLSMIAGYPVGAKMLAEMIDEGRLDSRRAEMLGGLCFGAGPAFINGVIAQQLYGSEAVGRLIFLSTAAANVLLALALSPVLRRGSVPVRRDGAISLNVRIVTECTVSAGKSLGGVCCMIMAFAAAASALESLGAVSAAGSFLAELSGLPAKESRQLILALLDVTAVGDSVRGNYLLLPYLCGLASFGGVCVIFQVQAINGGRLRHAAPLVLLRGTAGGVSFAVGKLIMPYILRNETAAVSSVRAAVHREPSPLPSVMLLIMVMMLICGTERSECRGAVPAPEPPGIVTRHTFSLFAGRRGRRPLRSFQDMDTKGKDAQRVRVSGGHLCRRQKHRPNRQVRTPLQ